MPEGEERVRGWDRWMPSPMQSIGYELGQTSGDGEGQRGLACSNPWGREELDTTG